MSPRTRIRLALTVLLALLSAACGGDDAQPTVDPSTADLDQIPGIAAEQFVDEIELALAEINAAEVAGAAIFDDGPPPALSAIVPVEVVAVRATADGVASVVMPAHPADDTLRPLYFALMDGLEAWVDGFTTGADTLEGAIPGINAAWQVEPPPRYVEITDELYGSKAAYDEACSALADAIVDLLSRSISCIAELPPPPEASAPASVGPLSITAPQGLLLDSWSDDLVWVSEATDDFISIAIRNEPQFAEPGQRLADTEALGNWPTDMTSWLEGHGAAVLATGTIDVSGNPAMWWEFTDDVPVPTNVAEIADRPIISLTGRASEQLVQLGAVWHNRIYRVDTAEGPLLVYAQGVNEEVPVEISEIPPFFPRAAALFEWADEALRSIELS